MYCESLDLHFSVFATSLAFVCGGLDSAGGRRRQARHLNADAFAWLYNISLSIAQNADALTQLGCKAQPSQHAFPTCRFQDSNVPMILEDELAHVLADTSFHVSGDYRADLL